MKKIKILPSILMLTLCVAILGVGVFAIAPTQNTISGSITINSANTPVSIQLLVDGEPKGDPVTVRSGATFDVGALAFNTSGVNSVGEVRNRKVTLSVTNLSTTQDLGVYFYKDGTTLTNDLADVQNVMLQKDIYATGDDDTNIENKMATAYFTPYYFLGASDGDTTGDEFDNVEMNISFECYQLFDTDKTYTFDFKLNIEPYVGNVGNADLENKDGINDDEYTVDVSQVTPTQVTANLIKFKKEVTTIPTHAFYQSATTGEHIVVIPKYITGINSTYDNYAGESYYACFADLDNLVAITVNSRLYSGNFGTYEWSPTWLNADVVAININLGSYAFNACNVKRVELSQKITEIPDSCFGICYKLKYLEIPSSVASIHELAFVQGSLYTVNDDIETIVIKAGQATTFDACLPPDEVDGTASWILNGTIECDENTQLERSAEHDNVYVRVK